MSLITDEMVRAVTVGLMPFETNDGHWVFPVRYVSEEKMLRSVHFALEAIEPMLEKLIDDARAEGAWGGPDWRDHL